MFPCKVCGSKDEMIALLKEQAQASQIISCGVCKALRNENEFLREQVRTLEDRMMALCGKLPEYQPHRRDVPTGDLTQPPYVDPISGKVYKYNNTLAMYDEVTDVEMIAQIRKEQSTPADQLEEQVSKIEMEDVKWHAEREHFINAHQEEWNSYLEQRQKDFEDIDKRTRASEVTAEIPAVEVEIEDVK